MTDLASLIEFADGQRLDVVEQNVGLPVWQLCMSQRRHPELACISICCTMSPAAESLQHQAAVHLEREAVLEHPQAQHSSAEADKDVQAITPVAYGFQISLW